VLAAFRHTRPSRVERSRNSLGWELKGNGDRVISGYCVLGYVTVYGFNCREEAGVIKCVERWTGADETMGRWKSNSSIIRLFYKRGIPQTRSNSAMLWTTLTRCPRERMPMSFLSVSSVTWDSSTDPSTS
jgi:hypothetical protein